MPLATEVIAAMQSDILAASGHNLDWAVPCLPVPNFSGPPHICPQRRESSFWITIPGYSHSIQEKINGIPFALGVERIFKLHDELPRSLTHRSILLQMPTHFILGR